MRGKGLTANQTLCKQTEEEEQFRPHHRDLPLRALSLRIMFVHRVNPAARWGYVSERTSLGWMREKVKRRENSDVLGRGEKMRGERERWEARSADEEVISVGEGDREWSAAERQASPTLRELSWKAAPRRFALIS